MHAQHKSHHRCSCLLTCLPHFLLCSLLLSLQQELQTGQLTSHTAVTWTAPLEQGPHALPQEAEDLAHPNSTAHPPLAPPTQGSSHTSPYQPTSTGASTPHAPQAPVPLAYNPHMPPPHTQPIIAPSIPCGHPRTSPNTVLTHQHPHTATLHSISSRSSEGSMQVSKF